MYDDKKESNYDKLTAAEREIVEKHVRKQHQDAVADGNSFAEKNPEIYQGNVRDDQTYKALLDRADGVVVVDRHGLRSAKLGDFIVREVNLFGAPEVHIVNDTDYGSTLFRAQQDGTILNEKGEGLDCMTALKARMAVTEALRDGKLDAQEVGALREFVNNVPNPARRNKECGPTMET